MFFSCDAAKKQYGVARITQRKLSVRLVSCIMGPNTILSKMEEDILVGFWHCVRHFPIPRDSLLDTVQKIITEQNRENPFSNNRPGKKWLQIFYETTSGISRKDARKSNQGTR